jgi:hypothetical protein
MRKEETELVKQVRALFEKMSDYDGSREEFISACKKGYCPGCLRKLSEGETCFCLCTD